jgi:hypothetical protein
LGVHFFEQPVLEQHLGEQFLQLLGFRPYAFNLVTGRFARGIAGEPLLPASKTLWTADNKGSG